jgi:tetrahydromethanopterin S-methyltransferase subunit B
MRLEGFFRNVTIGFVRGTLFVMLALTLVRTVCEEIQAMHVG